MTRVNLSLSIYIYIEREREREIDRYVYRVNPSAHTNHASPPFRTLQGPSRVGLLRDYEMLGRFIGLAMIQV